MGGSRGGTGQCRADAEAVGTGVQIHTATPKELHTRQLFPVSVDLLILLRRLQP